MIHHGLTGEAAELAQKAELAQLRTTLSDYKAFSDIWLKPSANGSIKFMAAVRALRMISNSSSILSVSVKKSGGTSVLTKNIGTYIGLNPLKLTGGSIVTFQLTEVSTGKVLAGGTLSCGTSRLTMSRVHKLVKSKTTAAKLEEIAGCTPTN